MLSTKKRRRSVSADKALTLVNRFEQDLFRLYRHTKEASLTQEQHLLNKRRVWTNIQDACLPGWANQQLYGYDRALYRLQEQDTVFVYQCPDTGKYYTTHRDSCPGLEMYPQEKIPVVHHWVNGKVWRHSKLPFFGDICV